MSKIKKDAVVFRTDSPHEARMMVKRYLENDMGHSVLFQGLSFECHRCGASATAIQTHALATTWKILGAAGEKNCTNPVNVCEHGDHPAPAGKRFCSESCAKCEMTDFDATKAECAGICRSGRS